MNALLEDFATVDKRIPMRDLIAGLQQTLQRNHKKILEAARQDWNQTYGAVDPANGCVSIQITPAKKTARRPRISGLN